jgi:curved DNA-binding protein CbpA
MPANGGDREGEERIPRLAPACDPTQLSLSPAEGYLLSRIDGVTSCRMLREIGGLTPSEVDRCIEGWIEQGVVQFKDDPPPLAVFRSEPDPAEDSSEAQIDPSLDLPVETQQLVLEFETGLDRPYHEILGVAVDADVKAIKKAYFGLSKQFHPDRYFRRNLGPYAERLERCFKKILEAYELLSDPATRAEVQNQPVPPAAEPAAEPDTPPAQTSPAGGASRSLAALRRLSRFGRRLQHFEARRRKAKTFFESGMAAFQQERWLEAAGSVRLAIAFDPANQAYKDAFADVQRKAHEERAKLLIKQGEGSLTVRDYRDAAAAFEEALQFRPFDPELNIRAARLIWQTNGDLRKAKEFAAAACELEPEKAGYRRTLGQIFKAAGLTSNARRELEAALRLDPKDAEARVELKAL